MIFAPTETGNVPSDDEEAEADFDIAYAICRHLEAVAKDLPSNLRWRLTLFEDRMALATAIASVSKPGPDGVAGLCSRWAAEQVDIEVDEDTWKKALKVEGQHKTPTAAPINAYYILTYDAEVRGTLRWNDYAKRVEATGGPLANRPNIDSMITAAQNWIATKYGPTIPRDALGHTVTFVAEEHSYNPLHDYLFGRRWDKKPRIDRFLVTYFGAEDTEHNRRIGRRWLMGCVSRALPVETWCTVEGREKGSKFDALLILEGVQGAKKSAAWEALGGRFYCASEIQVANKDTKMLAASNWFIDLPELAAFKTAEKLTVKSFLTNRTDTYRQPYGRGIVHSARQCVFCGSTNEENYLDDDTGNRRYWCVRCGTIDLAGLLRDRDQIWAEAVAIYLGEMDCKACHSSRDTVDGQRSRCPEHRWWLSTEEEAEAAIEASKRDAERPMLAAIENWWYHMPPTQRPKSFNVADVAAGLEIPIDRLVGRGGGIEIAIGIALKEMKFQKKRPMVEGHRSYMYYATETLLSHEGKKRHGLFALPSPKDGKNSP